MLLREVTLRVRAAVLGSALVLTPGASWAEAPTTTATSAAQPQLQPEQLTLLGAVHSGVERNRTLLSTRQGLLLQQAIEQATWLPYTPTVVFNADLARPRADLFGRSPVFSYSAGVVWQAPIGTVVSAEAVSSHGVAPNGQTQNVGGVVLAVRQPLLKDAWLTGAALPLREAELLTRVQQAVFREALNRLIMEVETAYWDLALAEADVVIKNRSTERARRQYEDTAENIKRGILADVEIYVVEENVVFFRQELQQAEQNLRLARTRMAQLLALEPDAPVRPAQALSRPAFTLPPKEELVAVGLETNPLIHVQRLRHALAVERSRFARNQALPDLDLTASLSLLGADPRYPTVWGTTLNDPNPEARVGLSFAVPLLRAPLAANVERAQLETQRAQVELTDTEERIRYEIVNGLTDLENNFQLLALTEKQVELAELKLSAETEKYKSGIATLADVVRFQRDLDNALIRLQRVLRAVHVGRARLLASQGTLHEAVGVAVR